MILIARNEGPKYNKSELGCLTPGKEYEVVDGLKHYNKNGMWECDEITTNPPSTEFFVRVIDDNGKDHDIWNDYFLSTDEMRDMTLKKLGI